MTLSHPSSSGLSSFPEIIDQTPVSGSNRSQTDYTAARTPIRHDIGPPRPISMFQSEIDRIQELSEDQPKNLKIIWGTNIVVGDVCVQFRNFLVNFSLGDSAPFYPQLLQQIREAELTFMNLDASNLRSHNAGLYRQLLTYPQEIIPIMDMVVNEYVSELFPGGEPIQIRPFNIARTVNMRELSPDDVDQLVAIKGLVIRVSAIIPDMRTAFFKCVSCGNCQTVENTRGKINEPKKCVRPECNAGHSMMLIHNRSVYSDKQLVKIQETPEVVPDGQTPHSVTVCIYDSLVDAIRAGDRVELTGIYRVSPIRINHRQRRIKSVFRTFVDVIHVKRVDDSRIDIVDDLISNQDLATRETDQLATLSRLKDRDLIDLSQDPDLYSKLANSIAPSIWKLEDVKKGLLLQLFGSVSKTLDRFGNTRTRGDIHILLTGDPSVSKSQLLYHVHKLTPRGIYTSGKGSSAVGLTAYVARDTETNQIVLESGALVLSDGGLCCIDEFDKMNDSTRAILHEVMEQQTVSVAKAGIITTLNARTSVLAAANPIDSKYNQNKSIVENIHLPPSLLSRFDLIYLILDHPNEHHDIQLARHITSLHVKDDHGKVGNIVPPVDSATLTRYISYARKHIHPILTDEAIKPLLDGYIEMRRVNSNSSGRHHTVSATTRQLESLIRLAEAHARMRLSSLILETDVVEAIRLVKSAILSYALDPVSGKIDMDMVITGKSRLFKEHVEGLKKHLTDTIKGSVEYSVLFKELCATSSVPVQERAVKQALSELMEEEVVHFAGALRTGTLIRRLL